jgi:phosphoglycerate dehydrogenase-like enzyme
MRHGLPVMTERSWDVADVRLVVSDRMRTIGIIGAGEVGSQIARAPSRRATRW